MWDLCECGICGDEAVRVGLERSCCEHGVERAELRDSLEDGAAGVLVSNNAVFTYAGRLPLRFLPAARAKR